MLHFKKKRFLKIHSNPPIVYYVFKLPLEVSFIFRAQTIPIKFLNISLSILLHCS